MVEAPIGFICRQIHARPFASGAVCFLAGILIADALPIIFWGVLAFAAILFEMCIRDRATAALLKLLPKGQRARIREAAGVVCHQCCFVSANIGHFYKSAIVLRVFFIFFHFLV